jgi:hypothetical protein
VIDRKTTLAVFNCDTPERGQRERKELHLRFELHDELHQLKLMMSKKGEKGKVKFEIISMKYVNFAVHRVRGGPSYDFELSSH